jgi:hypothetical protein
VLTPYPRLPSEGKDESAAGSAPKTTLPSPLKGVGTGWIVGGSR